jgi:Protein of unknown function (DUF3040)
VIIRDRALDRAPRDRRTAPPRVALTGREHVGRLAGDRDDRTVATRTGRSPLPDPAGADQHGTVGRRTGRHRPRAAGPAASSPGGAPVTSRAPKPTLRSRARPAPPGPRDRGALADLDEELRRTDPELAASLARLGVPSGLWLWLSIVGGLAALLLLGVLAGPAVLGIAGIVLAVTGPLLVCLAVAGGEDPDGDPAPPER